MNHSTTHQHEHERMTTQGNSTNMIFRLYPLYTWIHTPLPEH